MINHNILKTGCRIFEHIAKNLISSFQDKKDFIEKRVKRLLKAGVTSALAVMVKADSSILTDQTKEMLARWVSSDDWIHCLYK